MNPIALIGAGPSGLAGARALRRAGISFHGFEAGPDVGGLWNIDNPRSTMYESAHLISSRTTTEFAEFPMASTADYPGHRELLEYFRAYADAYGLREHFRFDTRVTAVEPIGGDQRQMNEGQQIEVERRVTVVPATDEPSRQSAGALPWLG